MLDIPDSIWIISNRICSIDVCLNWIFGKNAISTVYVLPLNGAVSLHSIECIDNAELRFDRQNKIVNDLVDVRVI